MNFAMKVGLDPKLVLDVISKGAAQSWQMENRGETMVEDEFEFGFDAGLLRDRLSVAATYFHKNSKDALISRRLQPSLGLTQTRFDNLGEIRQRGFELTVHADIVETDDVGFSLSVSGNTLDNEILELGDNVEDIVFNRGNQRHKEGFSAGAFFQPSIEFEDANGDGHPDRVTLYDAEERVRQIDLDRDGDGLVDVRSFYEAGRLSRREMLAEDVAPLVEERNLTSATWDDGESSEGDH